MPGYKVLVVDDSALMRRLLVDMLRGQGYEVITASNGADAVDLLVQEHPDAVTLDINMPKMDGLTALSLMMAARPTPIIMVSSLTERGALATLEALALGAFDYVLKPSGTISLSVDEIALSLSHTLKAALRSKPRTRSTAARPLSVAANDATLPMWRAGSVVHTPDIASRVGACPLVLIGVSTGGPRTLEDILPRLPANFPAAILIAQHMPANFTQTFAQRMDRICPMPVREANAVMPVQAGHVYIGQGGHDMVVSKRLGRVVVMPAPESAAHAWHPSVDVLVESAMKVMPAQQLVGVQLTGMGHDGAQAMAHLKNQGGKTIAESESSAVVFGMPCELIERGGASVVLPADAVADQLRTWLAA